MEIIPHKIGEPFTEPPVVFELNVNDHIKFVDPNNFGLSNVKTIDPVKYFITSGDAVEKTKVLYKHYVALYNELQELSKSDPTVVDYTKAIGVAVEQCSTMLQHLITAKGDHCFFETEWMSNRTLHVKAKDPRA